MVIEMCGAGLVVPLVAGGQWWEGGKWLRDLCDSGGNILVQPSRMVREHGRLRRPERFLAGFAHVAFPAEMPHAQNLQKIFPVAEATMLTDHPARLNENIAPTVQKSSCFILPTCPACRSSAGHEEARDDNRFAIPGLARRKSYLHPNWRENHRCSRRCRRRSRPAEHCR
jgi:hypothetical protein